MTFHSVGNVIIPTDELIFFRGVDQPPTRLLLTIINHIITIYSPTNIIAGPLKVTTLMVCPGATAMVQLGPSLDLWVVFTGKSVLTGNHGF
jgi:hypothetical protein